MSLHLVSRSSAPAGITRRIAIGAGLIAIGYVAALIASPTIQLPFSLGAGNATAVKRAPERTVPPPPASANGASPRDFDYFPDHYQNQAREPSQPADTF